MNRTVLLVFIALFVSIVSAFGQATSNIVKTDLSQTEIDRIVKQFTRNEALFRQALNVYVFNRNATVNTIGMGGQITGTYRRDSFMTFTEDGKRFERILFAPVPTVPPTFVTVEDLEDLGGVNPFALEPSDTELYNFTYLGKEHIDELDLYVFEVSPKVMPKAEKGAKRLFLGRIWVDDKDLMIVKSKGKGVPEFKDNKFPVVETWRENIDGKYWFPSYASSDDELFFDKGNSVKIRMRVKFTDYRLGRTDVKIVAEEDVPTPSPTPKKP